MTHAEFETHLLIMGFTKLPSLTNMYSRNTGGATEYVQYQLSTGLGAYQLGGPTSGYKNPKTIIEEVQDNDIRRIQNETIHNGLVR